jgi:hypothetical protein
MSIKVNVSDQENKSGEYKPLPAGNFHCVITDVDPRESQSEANPGKPMLYFTMVIQDGPYAEKDMGVNACCWDGALYTIIGILKAIGEYDNCKQGGGLNIPDAPEFYLGRDLMVRRGVNQKKKKENPDDNPEMWIEVRGFAKYEGAASKSSSNAGSSSLLP